MMIFNTKLDSFFKLFCRLFHVEQIISCFVLRRGLVSSLGFCLIFLVSGCDRPLTEPEKKDLIYLEIEKDLKTAQAALASEETSLEGTKAELANLPPRDRRRAGLIRERAIQTRNVTMLRQKVKFHILQLETRKKETRVRYQLAYREKKPWPDPDQMQSELTARRMKQASRNWSDRVPKRQPTSATPEPE